MLAMRMGLLGERLSAQEAYETGLVSHTSTEESYDEVVAELTVPGSRFEMADGEVTVAANRLLVLVAA